MINPKVEFPGEPLSDLGPNLPQSVTIHLNVEDVDAMFERAVGAGATIKMPLEDMFWGDRYSVLEDPFGHHWSVATHIRNVSPEEIQQAAQKACG